MIGSVSFKALVPPLGQRELNSLYYKRSLAKRNAEIDMQIKRRKVKIRKIKQNILNIFDKMKNFKLEFYLK